MENDMAGTTLGTVVGLVLGAAWAFGSFGQMLVVALFAIIGYVIAKVLEGDIDLTELSSSLSSRRERG
jgi:uncharacterized protein YcfJ